MSSTDGSSFRSAPGVRPLPVQKSMDDKLKDASKMYEKMFLREMVKAMRSTVQESGFIQTNQAEKIFRDELDQETVNNWGNQQGGVGIADMIYKNLIDKYGAQLGIKNHVQKPHGPIPITERSNYSGPVRVPTAKPQDLAYKFDRLHEGTEATPIEAPWSGTVIEKKDLGDGTSLLGLSHDHGLTGQFVFKGTPDRLNVGQSVQQGERIGLLSPEAKSFFWTLNVPE